MNRRETLKALGLAAAGTGLLISSCGPETKTNADKGATVKVPEKLPGVQDFEQERNNKLNAEHFFNEHEMATITVLADIIIPKDAVSGSASEAGVPAFIEFIVKDMPDHQIPMRGGLKWLDVQAFKSYGKAFADCSEKDQIALVDQIAYPAQAKPGMQQGVSFFSRMRELTLSGFYTSEIGVKDIGYVGNLPGIWDGVPKDVLDQYGFTMND
ncbi:Gluconate 2-dehydrogenase subunit 3 [bacterium A37T11]|nr:Gluconate 2-dehydrogenase subunit 3 [bacterium A37T11]